MLYQAPAKLPTKFSKLSLFLAGGISNCPDWQAELVDLLDVEKHDIVNPRRVGGLGLTGDGAEAQITWEHTALAKVNVCSFWFPKETLCPITLLEFGKLLVKAKDDKIKVILGWHEGYERAFDLQIQAKLEKVSKANLVIVGAGWDKFKDHMVKQYGSKSRFKMLKQLETD